MDTDDREVDRGARAGYGLGLRSLSRSTIGGNGAAVGGATAVDMFTNGGSSRVVQRPGVR